MQFTVKDLENLLIAYQTSQVSSTEGMLFTSIDTLQTVRYTKQFLKWLAEHYPE